MPAFLSNHRGTVVRVDSPLSGGPTPFAIRLQGVDVGSAGNPTTRAIITQAGIMENGNFQALHAMDETIYMYVFGDRLGELKVSGVCFTGLCNQPADIKGNRSGFKQVLDQYRRNRVANRGGRVLVAFGDSAYHGFLFGVTLENTDAEKNIGQWALRLGAVPAP